MKSSTVFLKWVIFPLAILTISHLSTAEENTPMSESHGLDHLLNQVSHWRKHQMESQDKLSLSFNTIIAWVLCFLASSISSAGGVGGGSLFLPILTIVAGMDLKKATAFSAFMVTGGSVANVMYNLFFRSLEFGGKSLIDYEISLLSEPCMLLGVSVGVVCNVVFPEWLITLLFALFIGFSTFKTCRAGFLFWKAESEEARRNGFCKSEAGNGEGEKRMKEPLLGGEREGGFGIPWKRMVVLVVIWLSFFALHVLRGDKGGKSVIQVRPCGVGYWLITLSQLPLAIIFTSCILYDRRRPHHQKSGKDLVAITRVEALPKVIFPLAALLSGILGGLFGIGGGLLMNPVLLQIGIPPQITAATTSFMILFSSSMSSAQYLMLGMKGIKQALLFTMFCFVASLVGLVIIQGAIGRSGRASLIVFSVSIVMALSTVSITCFGVMDVWSEYTSGESLWFNPAC